MTRGGKDSASREAPDPCFVTNFVSFVVRLPFTPSTYTGAAPPLSAPHFEIKGAFMRPLPLPIVLAPLLAVAACATAPAAPGVAVASSAARPTEDASSYGLFLAGQAAINRGHGEVAADYFGRATAGQGADDTGFLESRAFTAALLAGDVAKAAAFAPGGGDEPGLRQLGALVRGVEAFADGAPAKAHAILTGPDIGAPHRAAAALVAPWAAAAAGDTQASFVRPVIAGEPISQFFAGLDQGKLYERAGHYVEAETAFRALVAGGDPGGIASANLGELLERRGRQTDAVAIYDTALQHNPGDEALKAARLRAAGHATPPPLPSPRRGAAEAIIAPATALMVGKQEEMALAYLRLALRLDPTRDEAWMLAGDILTSAGDAEAAREAWQKPRPGSDQYISVRGKLAWSWQQAGDKDRALQIARETVARQPASRDAATILADILRADERWDESTKVLDTLIAAPGGAADWRLLYMRAAALQEAGRWQDAERDLAAALKLRPDEPELLNFLGYSWIDRGERLKEALAMVQKAVDLNPDSGAMLDSLGWGYYRLGDFKTAVDKLEAAIVLEPADPDVNDHLGDAYWRAGRRTEARFQWRRVLTLEPSAKTRAAVELKLASGLDAPPAPSVVAHE